MMNRFAGRGRPHVWRDQGCAKCVEGTYITLFIVEMCGLHIGEFVIGECDIERRN
jgi:hypothetical protein